MKKCIIALLLGFDEVQVFKKNYSSEIARVHKKIFAPHPIQQAFELPVDERLEWENVDYNSSYDYDSITVFHTDPKTLSPGITEPKYEYCIAISLLEPLVDELDAHSPCFAAVRSMLSQIENWDKDFKIIVRHHSLAGDDSISFDHKLMQERFVPGTHKKGFRSRHTYDVRKPLDKKHKKQPLTFCQAKQISDEITHRTKNFIHLSTLADWIYNILPNECTFTEHNPLKITMGGCYAGKRFDTDRALIQTLAHHLKPLFSTSFIQIIGSVSWTFYDDWRAMSFCDRYLDRESNDDPFRGVATKCEKKFFVKLPDSLRRFYTRMVTYNPNTQQITYSARPEKHSVSIQKLDYPIERNKILLSNLIMQIFIRHHTSHTRVPADVSVIIEQISKNIFPAFDRSQFMQGLQLSLALVNGRMYQSGPEPFLKFINQTKSILLYFIFFVIDERDGQKYNEIHNFISRILSHEIEPIIYRKIPQNIQEQYIQRYDALSSALRKLKRIRLSFSTEAENPFEDSNESTSEEDEENISVDDGDDGEEELQAFINITNRASNEKDALKIATDHRYYFAPLLTFINQLNQFLDELSQLPLSKNPLPFIRENINKIRSNLDQYWSTLR